MKEVLTWPAEKARYARIGSALIGRPTVVRDAEPGVVACTTPDGTVFLSHHHPLWDDLTAPLQIAFREGVVTHEFLHQILTDFEHEEFVGLGIPERERGIFYTICNVLEDPAIEHFAPLYVGGLMLKSLYYAISQTQKRSEKLQTCTSAFSQLMAAWIMFGDTGTVKGRFTFPEAETIYYETLPLFYSGIINPSGASRVDISKELFEKTRPLWEEVVEEEEEWKEFMKELKKMLDEMGKSMTEGSGSGSTPSGDPGETSKSKKQKKTLEMSRSDFEKLMKAASSSKSGSGSEKGIEVTVKITEDGKDGSASGSSSGSDSKKEKSEASESSGPSSGKTGSKSEDGSGESSDASSEGSESMSELGHREAPRSGDSGFGAAAGVESDLDEDELDFEDYSLTEEDEMYILEEAEREQALFDKETSSDDDIKIEDFDIESNVLKGIRCKNRNVLPNSEESISTAYATLVAKLRPQIKTQISQLRKIFDNDCEEEEYTKSGRIAFDRVMTGKVTARLFTKTREPDHKSDAAVAIVIDESGSMSCNNRYVAARECAVALVEIFEALKIPTYVMGFTADEDGYDAIHYHYVKWKPSKRAKETLLNISARSDNLDGYSIRYITKILKKRTEAHKLLIVISDGRPAANRYSWTNGIPDTKQAIRDAKKVAEVLGVAIDNSATEEIHFMYEKNFLHISNVQDLFFGLSKEIRKIFKDLED